MLVTLSALVWYVVASLFATALVQDDVGWNVVEALGRLLGASFFALLLWRLGWLDGAGVTNPGSLAAWLVVMLIMAFEVVAYQLALFGDLALGISDPNMSAAVGLNALATGPIEELPFRGIILYALLRIWGDTRKGIVGSVLVSAAVFSGSHLIHLALGRPPDMVAVKLLVTFLSGIYLAAFVLRWKTIWTVVVFHAVVNAVMTVRAIEIEGFAETASSLSMIIPFQVPFVLLGLAMIWKAPLRPVVPDAS